MALRDVLPRMNLPGEAMPWGRAIEKQVKQNARQLEIEEQFREGANRNTAAQLQAISDQIDALGGLLTRIGQQTQVATWQFLSTTSTTGFLQEYPVYKPDWASEAIVLAQPPIDLAGSSDRAFYLTMWANKSESPSQGEGTAFGSYFVTEDFADSYELPTSAVVSFLPGEDTLYLHPYQNVETSGSGTLGMIPFVTVLWVEPVA